MFKRSLSCGRLLRAVSVSLLLFCDPLLVAARCGLWLVLLVAGLLLLLYLLVVVLVVVAVVVLAAMPPILVRNLSYLSMA